MRQSKQDFWRWLADWFAVGLICLIAAFLMLACWRAFVEPADGANVVYVRQTPLYGGAGSAISTNGLVSHWSFDGNANDNFGTNNGVISGATLTTGIKGVADTAYHFDGTNDYISFASDDLNFTGNVTIAFWMRNTAAIGSGTRSPLSKNPAAAAYCDWLFFYNNTTTNTAFYASTSGSAWATITDAKYTNTSDQLWHFWVYDQTGTTGRFYIDTILIGSDTTAATGAKTNIINAGRGQGGINWWQGDIDQIRIYKVAIGSDAIVTIYNEEKP